jgi:hypothetical protein
VSQTPILDLEHEPPQPPKIWRQILLGAFLGLLPLPLLILIEMGYVPEIRWPEINDWLIIPAVFVSLAVHEFGHLLVGSIVGLGVDGLSVGPFGYFRSGDRWIFRFEIKSLFCGCYKPRIGAADHSAGRYVWMVAGGPLFSLALASATWLATSLYGDGVWAWAGTLSWVSLVLFLLSAIPYSAGLNMTDTARIWQLTRNPVQAKAWIALLDIQSQEAQGVRPKDWNSEHFELMLRATRKNSGYAYFQLMAHYRRLAEGMEVAALEHLENALSESHRMGKLLRSVIFVEAASASTVMRKQPSQARVWRDRACAIWKPKSLDGLDAEIAMLEGRYEDALKHLEGAKAYLDRLGLDSGIVRFARAELLAKEERCRAELATG